MTKTDAAYSCSQKSFSLPELTVKAEEVMAESSALKTFLLPTVRFKKHHWTDWIKNVRAWKQGKQI